MKKISTKRRSFVKYIEKEIWRCKTSVQKKTKEPSFTDFELLLELKNEIIRLNLQEDLSMTKFRKLAEFPNLPSVDTIMKRINKNWKELMTEIEVDHRRIKIYKLG